MLVNRWGLVNTWAAKAQLISVLSIPSTESIGNPILSAGSIAVFAASIGGNESVGVPILVGGGEISGWMTADIALNLKTLIILIDNTNLLELSGLRNPLKRDFINSAVVAATLQDAKGGDVAGQVWPTILHHVDDSDGVYRAPLSANLTLIDKKQYKLTIAAQGEGLTGRWETFITAQIRR
jgi:hypothetical protein